MNKLAWKPWHKVVKVRADLKSGELSLAVFAADLYDVLMGKARPVYQDPREFFALTYPTFNLRELAKDVAVRLAGQNDKAVRQLELTYGGGKTHTLITLYHLFSNPADLPDLPAVQEFVQHIGQAMPRARVAVLAFDKLDVEKGTEVRDPNGATRWLKQPWSVLAFQIAGVEGLRLLQAEGADAERDSAPAENLLVDLLALPGKQGLSTLILIDEVLMYAREKVGLDPAWRSRLLNFFQYLTQAATKVDRCVVVASLLATDPRKSDTLGKELTQELYGIFRREREESVQPVVKEDVAEVLRRRFFAPDSIRDREAFRPHVVAALKGIGDLDEQTRKEGKAAEDRFLKSYPFHPDLTEVFYTKWTGLEGFQRTRGVLRTFALALRDAERWDDCPLIGSSVFLDDERTSNLSEAARELTSIAATEEYEGRRQDWAAILQSELGKAREIQLEFPGLHHREVEQAVVATFLHSQPIGHKVLTRELLVLIGHTRPDKIDIEKALRRWTEVSWFLDEGALHEVEVAADNQRQLPKSWRLGSRPNLRQMHHDACDHVADEVVEARLLDEIGKLKSLTAGASPAGARVHNLPDRPRDVDDDGELHYVILGPRAASESGKPSAEARRFIDETTGADRPRVYRNALVIVTPSRDGLEAARNRIREYLGWEDVRTHLKDQEVDPIRTEMLAVNLEMARKKTPEAIQQAYCIVVTVSEKNDVQAFKLAVSGEPLFKQIKDDSRSRIQETAISAEALLPEGPYNLWRAGETARRVKDLVGAFAQFPHLPKMLNQKAILDTLVNGCLEGAFVLRLLRPDRSEHTFWRQLPDQATLKDPGLEVVLPEAAVLAELPATLLLPGVLPSLWRGAISTARELRAYFAGGHVVKIPRQGYDEPVTIPKADQILVDAAIQAMVQQGKLWLVSGPISILGEEIPTGLLSDDAQLQSPPSPVSSLDVLPERLPEAWGSATTTALAITVSLSKKAGKTLPWPIVREALDGAFRNRLLERTLDSGNWPCDFATVQTIKMRVPLAQPVPPTPPPSVPPKSGVRLAQAELQLNQLQDLSDAAGELKSATAGYDLKFRIEIELGGATPVPGEITAKANKILREVADDLELR